MPSDLLPGTLDMLILQTLTLGASHGYSIAQRINQVSGDALRVGEGSLYPALQRLLVEGWVTAAWSTSDTGRKVRAYQITPAGRKHLTREKKEYQAVIAGIARVLEAL